MERDGGEPTFCQKMQAGGTCSEWGAADEEDGADLCALGAGPEGGLVDKFPDVVALYAGGAVAGAAVPALGVVVGVVDEEAVALVDGEFAPGNAAGDDDEAPARG